jgi:hypothetical protein
MILYEKALDLESELHGLGENETEKKVEIENKIVALLEEMEEDDDIFKWRNENE